jgi:hypothetical protein
MASSSSVISASLSQSGNTIAVSSLPNHRSSNSSSNSNTSRSLRVLLFQVATGLLQTTLTYRSTETASEAATATGNGIIKVLFVGDTTVAAICEDKVVVWDLTRGVVAYTVPVKKDQRFVDAAAVAVAVADGAATPSIAVLVQTKDEKVQIHQFSATTGKLVRKIKVGKHCEGLSLAVSSNSKHLLIRRRDSLVVLDAATGEKVSKLSGLVAPAETTAGNSNMLAAVDSVAATISAGQVVLVHVETGAKITTDSGSGAASSLVVHDEAAGLQLFQTAAGETMLLVDGTRLFRIHVVEDGGKAFSCQPKAVSKLSVASDIDGFSMVSGAGQTMIAVLHQAGKFQVQSLPLLSQPNIPVAWNQPEQASAGGSGKQSDSIKDSTSSSSKRKAAETNSLTVLGPGQAGGEARTLTEGPASKKKRAIQDDGDENDDAENEGPTIAERLERLQKALDEESGDDDSDDDDDNNTNATKDRLRFSVKKATTESLTQLLQQALQSADDAMLELALDVRDPTVLAETCQGLSSDYLSILLTALTTRLASKPARAEHLCAWLTVILQSGKIRSAEHVQPLRNLIQERLEVFPALLKLDGRLSMMKSL